MPEVNYSTRFNRNLQKFFFDSFFRIQTNPATCRFLCQTWMNQVRAVRRRKAWQEKGVDVPPLMIMSITKRCNLRCTGCYSYALHAQPDEEIHDERLARLVDEADELGISIMLVAGGEPLLRPLFFEMAAQHPNILFLVFTNGLLINESIIQKFQKTPNLIPVLSLEGLEADTDLRRGRGIFNMVSNKMSLLKDAGILFGTSLTLTRINYDAITQFEYQKALFESGSRVSFFVDYVPADPQTEHLVLTAEQKAHQLLWLADLQKKIRGLFVALPGDEELYGGCLAGGRGFIHVNAKGDLEACPFAPFSDTSLTGMSLREALGSKLMRVIRENASLLSETRGGCTLLENREWVLTKMGELSK